MMIDGTSNEMGLETTGNQTEGVCDGPQKSVFSTSENRQSYLTGGKLEGRLDQGRSPKWFPRDLSRGSPRQGGVTTHHGKHVPHRGREGRVLFTMSGARNHNNPPSTSSHHFLNRDSRFFDS